MSESAGTGTSADPLPPASATRRSLLGALAAGADAAAFFGPLKANHAWVRAVQKKPLVAGCRSRGATVWRCSSRRSPSARS
jgi:hypothetical protein